MNTPAQVQAAPRLALMRHFDNLHDFRFVYVQSPGGYGKSSCVAMWLKGRKEESAWMRISESIGKKADIFCEYFIEALYNLMPHHPKLKQLFEDESLSSAPFEYLEQAIRTFRVAARKVEKRYILVIDDLHLVINADVQNHLHAILDELPHCVTLYILSREAHPAGFAEFALKGSLAVVGVEHLRFTKEEVSVFFNTAGQKLSDSQATEILENTGGWALGLNVLLMSNGGDTARKGMQEHFESFIRESIWKKWDEQRREFLLRISVVEEFTADFCTYATGLTNSQEVLDSLVATGAFIISAGDSTYQIHHLFHAFLATVLSENAEQKKKFCQKAGDYFFKRGDYFKAVKLYSTAGRKKDIAKCLRQMYSFNSSYTNIEKILDILRTFVDGSMVDDYPFILELFAWEAFVQGHGEDMEQYLDTYTHRLKRVILSHPSSLQIFFLLKCMDYRYTIAEMSRFVKKIPAMATKLFKKVKVPSITQNFPLFHRSVRDFSEAILYAQGEDSDMVMMMNSIGEIVGPEAEILARSLWAGLYYEQGNLAEAHNRAMTAFAILEDDFKAETKFCVYLILHATHTAHGRFDEAQGIIQDCEAMIERDCALYLTANFQAFITRGQDKIGDVQAARNWVLAYDKDSQGHLAFYKLYRHFTTVRAHMLTREFNVALLILKKLEDLCVLYRRPLDTIEVYLLYALAHWKRPRGAEKDAFDYLEKAITAARPYQYTQIFADEGANILPMLEKLRKRVVQQGYTGDITIREIEPIYIGAKVVALQRESLMYQPNAGAIDDFTVRQIKVMEYLAQGLTRPEIASQMDVSEDGVRSHIRAIYKKLGVGTKTEALLKIKQLKIFADS